MATDPRVSELLERWQELRAQGTDPTAEELCRTCPELTERVRQGIKALRAFDSLADAPNRSTVTDGSRHERTPPPAVAGFEILDVLGEGGMGVVYRARETRLNRIV